jgi:hypothetical protein
VILVIALVFLFIALAFAYLFTRLRMAMIGVISTEDTAIRPAMREFGARTWGYLGLIFLVALILLVPIALITVPAFYHFYLAFRQILPQIHASPGPQPGEFIPLFLSLELGLYGAIFLAIILLRLAESITRDLMMIPMALEDASLGESIRFLRSLFRVERGRTLVHILFHALLEVASSMVACILAYTPVFILGGFATLLGIGLGHGLWQNGPGGQLLLIAYAVAAALMVLAVLFVLGVSAVGTAAIFTQSHALEYLKPRYAPLNALMIPATTDGNSPRIPPFPEPPQAPPPAGIF